MVVIIPLLFRIGGSKEHNRLVLWKGSSGMDENNRPGRTASSAQTINLERFNGIQIELNVTKEYDTHSEMEGKKPDSESGMA
jgi:hypothetical protein